MSTCRGGRGFVVALVVLGACARPHGPRYGGLTPASRPFAFTHEVARFALGNGLLVALVPDDRSNLAHVELRYAVGAAEDPPGRAGLAHLVEHLLFAPRATPGGPTLEERLGAVALSYNASTTADATSYTTTVPIERLDDVLALEGERMRGGCEQLDDATFARERDVVLSETAERAGAGLALYYQLMAEVYGDRHPYAQPLGTNQIADVTRDEVCRFIAAYYAPDRAYLVVTGPLDLARSRALVEQTFGPITGRATGVRTAVTAPRLDDGELRLRAPIAHPTAVVFLHRPARGDADAVTYERARLRLAAALARADVEHDWMLATDVTPAGGARAPTLMVRVAVSSPERLEDAADEVFARAAHMFDDLDDRGTAELTAQARQAYLAPWDDGATRAAWVADALQDNGGELARGLDALETLDWQAAFAAVAANLGPDQARVALISVQAGGAGAGLAAIPVGSHDLAPWRPEVDAAEADRPLARAGGRGLGQRVEAYRLANGLNVQLAPDAGSPLVDARLVFPVGYAHARPDQPTVPLAAAYLLGPPASPSRAPTGDLEAGQRWARLRDAEVEAKAKHPATAASLDAEELLRWATTRGTSVSAQVDATTTVFSARGVAQWGDWHVWRLSWLFDQGGYDPDDLAALDADARARGASDGPGASPEKLAFLAELFGEGHPYATAPAPFVAASLDTDDLTGWKRDHYHAAGATLIVSGAFDVARMKREIDALFGPWSARVGPAPRAMPAPRPAAGPTWLAVADDDALQVSMRIGCLATSDPLRDRAARDVLVHLLDDRAREIRLRRGASYGIHVGYGGGLAGGALLLLGQLDEGQAGPALRELLDAIAALRTDAAGQREAFVRARRAAFADALAETSGATAIADQLERRARDHLPVDAFDDLADRIGALTPAAVAAIAAADLRALHLVVQLQGRADAIDAGFLAVGVKSHRSERAAPVIVLPEVDAERVDEPLEEPVEALPDEPDLPPGTAAERLAVGSKFNRHGPRRDGLFQGDRALSLDSFLRIAGDAERADTIKHRRWLRTGLVVGGLLTVAGGVVFTANEPCDARDGDCQEELVVHRLFGVGIVAAGVALTTNGILLDSKRPSNVELRRYAARYNRRRRIPADAQWTPVIGSTGGGVVVSGRF